MMRNPYRLLGVGLCLAGALFAPVAYLILESAPLTAMALSTIVIGIICIALANTRPGISPEACQILLKTGMENTAALLEELGLRNKALYLPSAMRDGRSQAIIPLEGGEVKLVQGKIPGRLIVRYGAAPDEMAIAVTTPGSVSVELLNGPPGQGAEDIEGAASFILAGTLDLADSVAVTSSDSRIDVLVKGARLRYEDIWYHRCLGSPIASIAAAICSEALGKPVRIKEESHSRRGSRVIVEVLS
ncbi:MAG: hypothetical protein JW753_02840 [Dehalococcoidia bacterium]|nr:hypothetical protein [Dehalococcoidia bacterium]